jgi:hypothetical protein
MSPGVLLSSTAPHTKNADPYSDDINAKYKTCLKEQPITVDHPVFVPNETDLLVDAGTARATYAPSRESPFGSVEWAKTRQHKTVHIPLYHCQSKLP